MKKKSPILLRLLRPGVIWTLLLAVLSVALLTAVFLTGHVETPAGYVIYVLSSYTLTVLAIGIPNLIVKIKALLYRNAYSNRYLTDIPFRAMISLYLSLAFNLAFAVFKLLAGILYDSIWFGAVAVYYIILCAVRFLLLRHVRNKGHDLMREFRQYRSCGILLFVLNIALTGMVIQMIHSGKGYQYPGFLIYAVAAYAFYSITVSIINLVRYRKLNSPVLSASKAIRLASALVSILSLQTAMFASFGGSAVFQRIMITLTGSIVCVIIFGMAIFMVIRANRRLKNMGLNYASKKEETRYGE